MNDQPAAGATTTPQVRTLLLTDLCESTTLVERLGDALAAALFREHDRLVLELQQRWRGRLIDRSDGLLLLFERPIDGLGFALDYMRGLHELGQARKLRLQARAGLHVGEVLTWQNSDEAVRAGAKSLEVEGLAKPLAGRLMSLARPGQILLSAVAEPMSHRAASELGERGQHLVWKSYGRWRFKGVPNAQEIFEVGEPGLAALRMPKHTAKAWRDIPLWRRPVALAAEMALLAVLGVGGWFLTRSPPAIAFNERDWVVVGDLRNLTGQPVLDESLEQAFRISLEQSRYVNVLSDLKVRDTLALMKRKPGEPLDRATASEVALRDGARAVILPTVAEVGGRVRVSAEVVDPHTQTTVYAESADGTGAASALQSIDKVTGELRSKLGEAIKSIERDSAPLPQVSTSNLDALKAYALGEKKDASGDAVAALGYYTRAFELDPQFALAKVAIGRVYTAQGKMAEGRRNFEAAAEMRDHLSTREALTLETLLARFGPVPALVGKWQQLVETYPDAHNARFGMAQDGWMLANQFAPMLPHARAANAAQFVDRSSAQYLEGMLLLGMEQYPQAIKAFEASRTGGYEGGGLAYAYAYEAQRRFEEADRAFSKRGGSQLVPKEFDDFEYCLITALDRSDWPRSKDCADRAMAKIGADDTMFLEPTWRVWSAAAAMIAAGDGRADPAVLRDHLSWFDQRAAQFDAVYPIYRAQYRMSLGYLAAASGQAALLDQALAKPGDEGIVEQHPATAQLHQVLLAEKDRLSGRARAAADRLAPIVKRDDALLLAHAAFGRALRDSGDNEGALAQARWVASHRGRAFVERGLSSLLDPLAVASTTVADLDAAELLKALGRDEESKQALDKFLSAWKEANLPGYLRTRVAALQG
ncbi:putative peptide modification system cyclase [Luteimonas sp. SX5]|uniref:Peptide modification system cyclase n=1 Tax=Luteimonas galliterrae TaxID=2940486 RepID=A0ABT0MLW9_9GAMM|nr:putative peptide modification system cyclase [Luteimonas galliterrae]MCL1635891.1 putative peptide modification system cyclase [Luteimonas galliterrae]